MASRDLKYSELILFTGAGASKACGLPDMREFARKFRDQIRSVDHGKPTADLLVDILSAGDEPATDLEGLMTALTSLGGETSDPAVELLLDRARLAEKSLVKALQRLADGLADWTSIVPLSEGPYEVVQQRNIFSEIAGLGTSTSRQESSESTLPPLSSQGPFTLSPASVPPFLVRRLTRADVDRHRDSLSAAHKTLDDRRDYFAGLRPAASELLHRLKADIQNTYSDYDAAKASRSYKPLLNEFARRYPCLDVFTLNYDTVIERVLASLRRRYSTGFRTAGEHEWSGLFPRNPPEHSVRLYKLHGSVNWFELGTRAVEMPVDITGVSTHAGPAPSMMIYPLTQKLTYDEPHLTLFHHFSRALKSAGRCMIIGCSLRDELVSSILAFAARERRDLRFIFCGSEQCIESNHWLKRFRRRFTVMDRRFGDDGFLAELKTILGST